MDEFRFDFEWIDPASAKGPELRATWAELQLSVGDRALTRLIDESTKSVRTRVALPLYPLAEWLIAHWWFLLHEVPTPSRDPDDYVERHSLRSAAEGYALPTVLVVPTGDSVYLEWFPSYLRRQRVEFTESGSARIPIGQFKEATLGFLSAVVSRLKDQGVHGTVLEADFDAVTGATSEEQDFCTAAAALGVDPYALDDSLAARIIDASSRVPPSLLSEFLAVADHRVLISQVEDLNNAIDASRANRARLDNLKILKRDVGGLLPASGPAWEQGYVVARRLRQHLHLDGTVLTSLNALGEAIDVGSTELGAAIVPLQSAPQPIEALVDVNGDESPGFVIGRQSEAARVFTFCRALFEYLIGPSGAPQLITRARSEHQKRNRAFAAEFLVPAATLQDLAPRGLVTDEDVDDLAGRFGVSPLVIRHQLANHRVAKLPPWKDIETGIWTTA